MSGVKIRESIINGRHTCEEVIMTFIHQARESHKRLNCLLEEHYDQAWTMAIELDRTLDEKRKEGEKALAEFLKSKPLLGIPLSIKDPFIMKVKEFFFLNFKKKKKNLIYMHPFDPLKKNDFFSSSSSLPLSFSFSLLMNRTRIALEVLTFVRLIQMSASLAKQHFPQT
ncbi:hypothetical protein RFI_27892 [Reticulomyxa filosa]|uniref:Uncharacterized protein n=1 Tax=Reticulomyxa filosa TaxID=46433 RepID=X6M7Q6_RETFI|nr:hypothetical protein RFI_27892 [Reticulomyxa filosa]|eukprot:ETO09482.1 hypothetical protein RFI_27892 [Reticulomyxa filosa]